MNPKTTRAFVDAAWSEHVLPALHEYIRIPAQSPAFDPEWEAHGHVERAVQLAHDGVRARELKGAKLEILRLPGRTPLLLVEVDGTRPGTVLLYGHLDKQPPFDGWKEGFGPWTPVLRDERLYGRGSADDGYAVFAAVTAIGALQAQGVAHPRCVLVIEASEESGSPDLPAHVDAAAGRIGTPDLVICLDSGCGDYERLWLTTSLRGMLSLTVRAEVLNEGVHSGDASGVVPSSFRVLRQLLDRIEDSRTGRVLLPALSGTIPPARVAEARAAASVLGRVAFDRFPWIPGVRSMHEDVSELVLNRTWRPTISYTGAEGLPPLQGAGNVLRPSTALKLSVRLPPNVDAGAATRALTRVLQEDPPQGARVTVTGGGSSGWQAPELAPWLGKALGEASRAHFGEPHAAMGEGGSIPFMTMLGERFPETQFVITGVLGPESNAHGPNEFLHVPTARSLTCAVAQVITKLPG
jgi:acetylornithine deacetylase/succinyl-diaminopimelate desuccinylase-like protein